MRVRSARSLVPVLGGLALIGWAIPVRGQTINLVELTAEQIQKDYAAGKYTAVQLTRAYLDRIAQYEDVYNAFISMNPRALEVAAELDAEYRRSGPRGPLHGVPIVIKDNIDYAGLVTTAGYAGFSKATGGIDMVPDDDAAATERLRNAGAIILGKTNLPDFAGDGTRSKSTVAGATRNAYDVNRAPGGSSGGTATAVSASFAVLGLGTETGGSIENPSAAQGVVGIKPTFGLVPLEGVVPIDATYRDVVGPMARTVTDAVNALQIIAGPTNEDLATYSSVGKTPANGYVQALDANALRGKRFGLVGLGWRDEYLPLAPETEKLYRSAIEVLKAQGAEVVEDPFLNSGWKELYDKRTNVPGVGAHDMLVYFMGLGPNAAFHSQEEWEKLTGRRFRERGGGGGAAACPSRAGAGGGGGGGGGGAGGGGGGGNNNRPQVPVTVSATEEGDAFGAWRKDIRALFRKVLADNRLDGLFFPQAGGPIRPFIEDPSCPDYSPNNHPELPSNIINDLGLPVITMPVSYYADGMPFNIAFIGDLWTEPQLIGYAYDLEQATKARRAPTLITRLPDTQR
jgi:Asp-tRNA(Asn)/Glu-tRNA(Gln) amidotransferase A subunit family amidase